MYTVHCTVYNVQCILYSIIFFPLSTSNYRFHFYAHLEAIKKLDGEDILLEIYENVHDELRAKTDMMDKERAKVRALLWIKGNRQK